MGYLMLTPFIFFMCILLLINQDNTIKWYVNREYASFWQGISQAYIEQPPGIGNRSREGMISI